MGAAIRIPGMHPHFWNWDHLLVISYYRTNFICRYHSFKVWIVYALVILFMW